MKNQFQSTEDLVIRLTPFVSKANGSYIVTGTDVCTLSIEKPNGTLHTGTTVTAAWDAVSKTWKYTITTGSYVQGEWVVYAVSNDADCLPKWLSLNWGDYVNDITTTKTSAESINTKLGAPVGASLSVDIATTKTSVDAAGTVATAINTKLGAPSGASVSADIAAINTKLGTPSGASIAADVTTTKTDAAASKSAAQAAQSSALSAAADAAIIKKIQLGRWRVVGSQLVLYDADGSTELKRFDLKDDLGNPSGTRVFERIPQ